jgi:hypothetical protein
MQEEKILLSDAQSSVSPMNAAQKVSRPLGIAGSPRWQALEIRTLSFVKNVPFASSTMVYRTLSDE